MQHEILVNQRVYALEVVYAASYVYVDRCYVLLDRPDKTHISVKLKAKPECSKADFDKVVGEFTNELLSQALRQKLSKSTGKLREAIVHRALFSAMAPAQDLGLPPEQNDLDYLDDPLGIAVPWEDKFTGDSGKKNSEEEKQG